MMSSKEKKYNRLYDQLKELVVKSNNYYARLATIQAVLHHKIQYYFWTGSYFLIDDELTVQSYQGPVACQILKKDNGVCWAAINSKETLVVDNVEEFPGHIACNSASKSEIVVPLRNKKGDIIGCFDVDSKEFNSFDKEDARGLEKILDLLYI